MTDILFVHANASNVIYQDLSKYAAAIEPPIWAAMLANHVRLKKKKPEKNLVAVRVNKETPNP